MHRTYIKLDEYDSDYDDIEYLPDNAEDPDATFNWEAFVREALGNLTYAENLAGRAEWAYPSTMIDEDLQEGFIRYDVEEGTIDILDEDGNPEDAFYDESFFDPATAALLS